MPTVDLYYSPVSSPCRAVFLVAKAVGVDLNIKPINFRTMDHFQPDFLKMNPLHTVPVMHDNGFYLFERAIECYLVNQYAQDDSLYPKDPKKRALVDERLYFDMGTLYGRFMNYYYPFLFAGGQLESPKLKQLEEAYQFFDGTLVGKEWATGDSITIADYALAASVTTAVTMGFDIKRYPNVEAWYDRAKKTMAGFAENYSGAVEFSKYLDEAYARES